nr:integrin alpha-V-like [Cherax quadricarinatus]
MDDNGYSDLVIGAAESNTALFIRSSPVVRLVGGVYFTSETVMVDDKINCKIEKAGYQTIHGVCFDLTVNITYDTYKKFDNLEMQFKIVLEGPEDPSHFGFKINNDHSFTMTRRVYFKSRNSQWSLQVFFKRVRSNIGQTLRASVTVSLLQQDADEATSDAATAAVTLAPVLDTFSASNTYVTNTTLVCPDNRTCFASPDLHLVASSHPFTLGEKSVLVEVQLQVHHDPGYQVKVEVRHPEGLEYMRVEGKGSLPFCSDQKLVNQIASSFVCVFDFIDPDVIVNFTLVFEMRAVQVLDYLTTNNLTFLTLNLHVTSDTDTENNTLNNDATVIIPVITKAILYTKAYSLLESTTVMVNQTASSEDLQKAMKDPNTSSFSVDKLGPHLLHEFSLTNRGPSPVRGAKLRFQLPLYRSDHLLTYYMGQPATTPHVTCTTITTNPYNLQTSSSSLPSVFKRSTVLPSVTAATTTTLDNTTSVTTTSEDFTFATHVYDIDDGTTSWPETLQMRHRRQVHLEEEEEEEAEGDQLITPASAFTSQPFQGR